MRNQPFCVSVINRTGHPNDTRIVRDDGSPLRYVRSFVLRQSIGQPPSLTIEVVEPPVSLENLQAIVPIDDVIDWAASYGYVLVPKDEVPTQAKESAP